MKRIGMIMVVALPVAAQEFAKDVAPILAANCLGCHAPLTKMGGLSVESADALKTGGNHGPAIFPGKSSESRLYLMLTGAVQPAMPMGGQKLAAGDIETIRKWIDAGAQGTGTAGVLRPATPIIKPRVAVRPQIFSLAQQPGTSVLALGGFREVRIQPGNRILSGHADAVRSLAFSPDGKLLAAAGGLPARRGEVKLWDVSSGAELRTLGGHADAIYAVAFSPDGKQIATAGYDKLIKLWDAGSGAEVRTLKDHIDAINALAFTPDGRRLISGAADRTIKIWDSSTGRRLYTLSDASDGINTVAVDPTGTYVAAAGVDKSIRIWRLGDQEGELLHSLMAHEDAILRLAWSPDGRYLASAAADRTIKVFRASDLSELKTFSPQPDWVYGLAFTSDGKSIIAGRFDGSVSTYTP
ncbi:MAG TPA: c-type cytochrome domain-containing protein [Bryobacteraceae bacterium]|nr:c-type cytochrome domain-containing protein [Bryobacteraceae bacterium]